MSITYNTGSARGRILRAPGRGRLVAATAGCLLVAGSLASCSANDSMLILSASSAQDGVRGLAEASPGEIGVASGGSSSLVRQLSSGAQADVLITADEATMTAAADAGLLASEPVTVAVSQLVLAVPAEDTVDAGRPPITGLADLASGDVDLVLCAEPVPCGTAAREALDAAGVDPPVRSFEPNSRQALSKVALGVADAALVWEVDVASEERASVVRSAGEMPVTHYMAAVVRGARHPDLAEEFIVRMESDEGQALLAQFGFLPVDQTGTTSGAGTTDQLGTTEELGANHERELSRAESSAWGLP